MDLNSYGKTFNETAFVYVDIETLPSPEPPSLDEIQAPGNYKDEAKIRAYKESKVGELHRQQALDSMTGEILAIGYAIGDDDPVVLMRGVDGIESEQDLLGAFDDQIGKINPVTWVGHNLKSFDAQWLWRKAIKYGLPSLARKIPRERYSRQLIDTMELWAGPDYRDRTSLDKIAKFLGLAGKNGIDGPIDGSMVFDMWQAGKLDEIAEYCASDVELTRGVYKIITGENEAPGSAQPQAEHFEEDSQAFVADF